MSEDVGETPTRLSEETLRLSYPAHYLKTLQNRQAPVSNIPEEVLLRIFAHAVDDAGYPRTLRYLTHVCRDWREVAVEAPLLWTRSLSTHRPKWTALALHRARRAPTAPLKLDLNLRNGICDLSKALLKQATRATVLTMKGTARQLLIAEALIPGKVNSVQELELTCVKDDDSDLNDLRERPVRLLLAKFSHACRLRSLRFDMVDIDINSRLLRNLTTLQLRYLSSKSIPTWSQLVEMLRRMPTLRKLDLHHVFPEFDASAFSLTPVDLPSLEDLAIECVNASEMQMILALICCANAQEHLRFHWYDDDAGYPATLRAIAHAIDTERIGKKADSLFVLQGSDCIWVNAYPINIRAPDEWHDGVAPGFGEASFIADYINLLCLANIAELELEVDKDYEHAGLRLIAGEMPFLYMATISFSMAFTFFEVLGQPLLSSKKGYRHIPQVCFPRLAHFKFASCDFLDRDEWVAQDAMEVFSTRLAQGLEFRSVDFDCVQNLTPDMVSMFEENVEEVKVM